MELWTAAHAKTILPALAVMVALCIVLRKFLGKKDLKIRMIPLQIVAILLVVMEVGNYAVCANAASIEGSSVTANRRVMVDGVKVIIAAVYQDYRMLDVTLDTDFTDGLSIPVFVPWDGRMEEFHLDADYAPFGTIS